MIYFVRYDTDGQPLATASAESERTAAQRGGRRCSVEEWRAARAELDRVARLRIAREDEQEAEWRELRRIVGKRAGVVYPVKVNEG
jgi:hypothetical protein